MLATRKFFPHMDNLAVMRLLVLAAALVLVAGCSNPGNSSPEPTTSSSTTSTGPAQAPQFKELVVPIQLSGNLGNFVHGCVFPAGQCVTQDLSASNNDVLINQPGANLTSLQLNLTWTASPTTQQLGIGSMAMANCSGCPSMDLAETAGTSPLRHEWSGQVLLNESLQLHIYVYDPDAFQLAPGGAGYTYVTTEQDFVLEGVARFLIPA